MSEAFIIKEYGTRTPGVGTGEKGSARALSLPEVRKQRKDISNLLDGKKKRMRKAGSLQEQREFMRARRGAYEKLIDAGVISSTKEGKRLITGETAVVKQNIINRMQLLSDRQLDVFASILKDKTVVDRLGAYGWFNRRRKELEEQRNTQAMLLNFNAKDLYNQILQTGKPLFDDKGFDLDISMDKIGFQYKVEF